MKDTYYINKQYHTLVRVTYNPTKRQYNVLDYSRYEDERMSVVVVSKYYKKDYYLIRAFDREYNR